MDKNKSVTIFSVDRTIQAGEVEYSANIADDVKVIEVELIVNYLTELLEMGKDEKAND